MNLSYLQEWNTETDSATLNVMTYNIALTKDNAILEYLDTLNIDILALQESGGLPKKNNLRDDPRPRRLRAPHHQRALQPIPHQELPPDSS